MRTYSFGQTPNMETSCPLVDLRLTSEEEMLDVFDC